MVLPAFCDHEGYVWFYKLSGPIKVARAGCGFLMRKKEHQNINDLSVLNDLLAKESPFFMGNDHKKEKPEVIFSEILLKATFGNDGRIRGILNKEKELVCSVDLT